MAPDVADVNILDRELLTSSLNVQLVGMNLSMNGQQHHTKCFSAVFVQATARGALNVVRPRSLGATPTGLFTSPYKYTD